MKWIDGNELDFKQFSGDMPRPAAVTADVFEDPGTPALRPPWCLSRLFCRKLNPFPAKCALPIYFMVQKWRKNDAPKLGGFSKLLCDNGYSCEKGD